MAVSDADIQEFAEFARQQARDGELTMMELARKWHAAKEREAAVSAIREGLADIEAGRTRTFEKSMDEFRQKHNLPAFE